MRRHSDRWSHIELPDARAGPGISRRCHVTEMEVIESTRRNGWVTGAIPSISSLWTLHGLVFPSPSAVRCASRPPAAAYHVSCLAALGLLGSQSARGGDKNERQTSAPRTGHSPSSPSAPPPIEAPLAGPRCHHPVEPAARSCRPVRLPACPPAWPSGPDVARTLTKSTRQSAAARLSRRSLSACPPVKLARGP